MDSEFRGFSKIARLSKDMIITEKIDGTNACIFIGESGEFKVGKRTQWITPQNDNYGFAAWAYEHEQELKGLPIGFNYGEWYGSGIQRRYGLTEKRFALFNVSIPIVPICCSIVPVLYGGIFDTEKIEKCLHNLKIHGSYAAPGFMNPEGVVVWHSGARICFKKTFIDIGKEEHGI